MVPVDPVLFSKNITYFHLPRPPNRHTVSRPIFCVYSAESMHQLPPEGNRNQKPPPSDQQQRPHSIANMLQPFQHFPIVS
jgi:hypothetical protein